MNSFTREIKDRVLVYDGSKGYMLQLAGLNSGECGEYWNITRPDEVQKVYSLYKNAGADVIQTNTFPGNRIHLSKFSFGDRTYEINFEGTRLAKEVMRDDGFVAASIGPTGLLFEPSGELTFDLACDIFKEQVTAVIDGGADIINFETFTDLAEMRAALIAAKEVTNAPVICSLSFESHGRTLMGTDPATAVSVLKALGADMVGTNCSLGPEHLLDIIRQMYEIGGVYLSVKPNAGLPVYDGGRIVYEESAEAFAGLAGDFVKYGVRLIGGCCGTTPEHVKAIKAVVKGIEPGKLINKSDCIITSGVRLLNFDKSEKINIAELDVGAGTDLYGEISRSGTEVIAEKALELADSNFDAVYIEANGDSVELLAEVVNTAQAYLKEPVIIETDSAGALDAALRLYKGKAGVVLSDYSEDNMAELLVVAKKYGSTIFKKSMLENTSVSKV